MNKVALITSDLSSGGSERVVSILANNFALNKNIEVHLIFLIQGEIFYDLNSNVNLHIPKFHYKNHSKIFSYVKTFFYLRSKLKQISPSSYLCFGGRYNSLSIMAGLYLNTKSYISDRSQPGISYGKFIDILNKIFYPFAYGIIAQTNKAKQFYLDNNIHNNIKVIGNPIPFLQDSSMIRKNIILNVGRFVHTKNQQVLIDIFDELNLNDWELWFVGDGPLLQSTIDNAKHLKSGSKIKFLGNIKDVKSVLNLAKIFAFTSTSEGFPNALGEALSAGLVCISFDCNAGPAELIDDEVNGCLISDFDKEMYKLKLQNLTSNYTTYFYSFVPKSQEKIKKLYSEEFIIKEYLYFLELDLV